MKLVYLTSGAAGMYCGSCMHDNTLAKALITAGVDVTLAPTYTPIRTDEEDVSIDRVFFGGLSIYLQQKAPLFRYVPAFMDRFLDNPRLIRLATSRAVETSAKDLGSLTVSMLKGKSGRQRKEVDKLVRWLAGEARPDALLLSNMLIAGCVPAIKEQCDAPVLVTLQGDDIFLNDLPEPYRSKSLAQLRELASQIDGYVCHSKYYADHMAEMLSLPPERIHVTPLGIDSKPMYSIQRVVEDSLAIGYLARLAPEKGLHNLVDAFIDLCKRHAANNVQLRIAGWLGRHNEAYAEQQFDKLREAGLQDRFEYVGSLDHAEKLEFLSRIDVLSVPTDYQEPKGLFVLESLAAGVPVVQPAHGAFPELLERTGGGLLVRPGEVGELADALAELLRDAPRRRELGESARQNVHAHHDASSMARAMLQLLEEYCDVRSGGSKG